MSDCMVLALTTVWRCELRGVSCVVVLGSQSSLLPAARFQPFSQASPTASQCCLQGEPTKGAAPAPKHTVHPQVTMKFTVPLRKREIVFSTPRRSLSFSIGS